MALSSFLSDYDLLRLMMAGNEEAFTILYRRRQGGIYRFAIQMSGSESIAEDVTQEVFLLLMREAAGYDPERGSLSAYLYGIARNFVLRRLQQDQRFAAIDDEKIDLHADGDRFTARADLLADLTKSETVELVRAAVLSLPPRYREVVVLCDLQEVNYADAAVIMGCAVGTVRSRLHRARALLAEKLRATVEEPRPVTTARCFA
ncbi:MAG: RNA polymerase subunit sigma-70 [Blastocatellia bacterium AA13]|nr:MAG: RNA polymerase subunit sigma-70 [Blastocatellia bacterium AA13]